MHQRATLFIWTLQQGNPEIPGIFLAAASQWFRLKVMAGILYPVLVLGGLYANYFSTKAHKKHRPNQNASKSFHKKQRE